MANPCVVVAGAAGFIGQALGSHLHKRYRLIGLSRSERPAQNGYEEFRQVDLFSLRATESALKGANLAIYLVHSMMPSARLVQGDFQDLDILCADNFARAACTNGIKHIVYISGLIPPSDDLSEHLQSRLEVEKVLSSYGTPVTTLRAGMVVGAHGSSYQLLARLVKRIPILLCPSWTQTLMQPIAINDVITAVSQALEFESPETHNYDIGAPQQVTYKELMQEAAKSLGLKRIFISVPFFSPGFSRLWVSLTTGAPKDLAAPLIRSMEHQMLAREDNHARLPVRASTSVSDMLLQAAKESEDKKLVPRAFQATQTSAEESKVCSVQRMKLPNKENAEWVAQAYFDWLPKALRGLIAIKESEDGSEIFFKIKLTGHTLLGLRRMPARSSNDRQVLKVTKGLLAIESDRGRLEFRQVLDSRTLIASIQDFVPRLPWWIYRSTQGIFHKWVMFRFRKYLKRLHRPEG
ncbi:MAG: NAD-dependent epimerase/dehydratase family protein [Myxococcota bacterium]|nr:NAD-dependent epimerase/dehydratase family protein [Myxococcota bacterium]